jgi:hypothetical protein
MNAPGWQPDPTTRHEYRYWDGAQWTDDVSDGGVTSVDPVDGSGAAPGASGYPSSDATQAMGPATQAYGSAPYGGPPPGGGSPPPGATPSYQGYGADPYGSSYGSGQMPPGQPVKRGPNPALIIGIVVVVVLLLGGGAYALMSGGDDDDTTAGTTTTTAAGATTTTSGTSETTTTEGTTETTEDTSSANEDSIVPLIAEGIQESAPELTDEQAECIAQVIVDEVGLETLMEMGVSGDPSNAFSQLTTEQQTALATAMLDCAPADVLAGAGT